MKTAIKNRNAKVIEAELQWLKSAIERRFRLHFEDGSQDGKHDPILPPSLPKLGESSYSDFIKERELNSDERLLLALALCPNLQPSVLDPLLTLNTSLNRQFTAFGGFSSNSSAGFWPTGETALWLLAGADISKRFEVQHLLTSAHFFTTEDILRLESISGSQHFNPLGGQLVIGEEFFTETCLGETNAPSFGADFPAEQVQTEMERKDIVLSPTTWNSVDEILEWLEYKSKFEALPGMSKRMRPGFRALFFGPPGTGKTMVTSWLGKETEKPVYRIDLSMVVSKYIGETEKNLAKIFRRAAFKDWILFFDEADALFGKRTGVSSSNDRHANQEVSYLLQRVEHYPGLVILASNYKDNMDEAFIRRFDLMAHFSMPNPQQRMALWKHSFSPALPLDPELDIYALAKKYELSGGHITNVVRYASMKALSKGETVVKEEILREGIRKEMAKMGVFRME